MWSRLMTSVIFHYSDSRNYENLRKICVQNFSFCQVLSANSFRSTSTGRASPLLMRPIYLMNSGDEWLSIHLRVQSQLCLEEWADSKWSPRLPKLTMLLQENCFWLWIWRFLLKISSGNLFSLCNARTDWGIYSKQWTVEDQNSSSAFPLLKEFAHKYYVLKEPNYLVSFWY